MHTAHGTLFIKVAECLYRHKSSELYYGLVKRNGKQFRRSLKTNDRKLAERKLANFRTKVSRLTLTNRSQILFEELAKLWLERIQNGLKVNSVKRRETSINQLKPHFGEIPVRNITARDCDEWVTKRGKKISASTFNNERETLRLILDFACRDGLLLDNPALTIERRKQDKPKIVIPTHEQFRLLVETIRKADRRAWPGADLVELLAYSGMRLNEGVSLTLGEVDLERKCFTVSGGEQGTKNHETRTIPLFPALEKLLLRLRGANTPSAISRVIPISDAKNAIKNACVKAKLPHFSHHTMRHYFVSNAIEAGIDFKTIAALVGHKDGGVLVAKTYGHLRDTHSFEMAKRMTFDANNAGSENVVMLNSRT